MASPMIDATEDDVLWLDDKEKVCKRIKPENSCELMSGDIELRDCTY